MTRQELFQQVEAIKQQRQEEKSKLDKVKELIQSMTGVPTLSKLKAFLENLRALFSLTD